MQPNAQREDNSPKSSSEDLFCKVLSIDSSPCSSLGRRAPVLNSHSHAAASRREPSWETVHKTWPRLLGQNAVFSRSMNTPPYPTAIAALAGTALLCSGSTATQGRTQNRSAALPIFLLSKCRDNGLIGDPPSDVRYTYGHGFAMLFLSQVLGEEGFMEPPPGFSGRIE